MELSEFIINKIENISPSAFIIFCIFLLIIINWIISKKDFFIETWNKFYEHRKQKEELLQMLVDDHNRIKEYEENRIHDRKQSFQIQKQLIESQQQLDFSLAELKQHLISMEEKQNKKTRADLKDKIRRSYQVYHERGEWNDMEKESLEGLIEEYECAAGTNSFVHDIVQPEMYTWKLVERI